MSTKEKSTKRETESISRTELGALVGVHRNTITDWVEKGLIPVKLNSQGKRFMVKRDAIPAAKELVAQRKLQTGIERRETNVDFNKAKAEREGYNAKLARLNYEQKVGELVKVEVVEKRIYELALQVRDSLLSIPNKISPELASMTNERKINAFLDKTIREAIESLADEELSIWTHKKLRNGKEESKGEINS